MTSTLTREMVYDLACARYAEPAVALLNGDCVIGWPGSAPTAAGIPRVARATTWDALARLAGLVPSPSSQMLPPPPPSARPVSAAVPEAEPAVTGVYPRLPPGPGDGR